MNNKEIVYLDNAATTKTLPEVLRQALKQALPARRALFAALLKFNNAPTNFPIRCRHQSVDSTRSSSACRFQQCDDVVVDGGVGCLIGRGWCDGAAHACTSAISVSIQNGFAQSNEITCTLNAPRWVFRLLARAARVRRVGAFVRLADRLLRRSPRRGRRGRRRRWRCRYPAP